MPQPQKYDKLVRDLIPDIIRRNGQEPVTRIAAPEEKEGYLIKKVLEEAAELRHNPTLEEMADLLEVIYALAEAKGATRQELEALRQKKAHERGGFGKGIILLETLALHQSGTGGGFWSASLSSGKSKGKKGRGPSPEGASMLSVKDRRCPRAFDTR